MKFKLPTELKKLQFYYEQLESYEGIVELKKILKPRTINQNKFLHVLITLFGIELGYTIEEAKTLLKRNCSFMVYEKKNEQFLRRTRDMNTKELADFITWIMKFAIDKGIYLPSADDYKRDWTEIERTIESNKHYL